MNYENFTEEQKLSIKQFREWVLKSKERIKKCNCNKYCVAYITDQSDNLVKIIDCLCSMNFCSYKQTTEVLNFIEEKKYWVE